MKSITSSLSEHAAQLGGAAQDGAALGVVQRQQLEHIAPGQPAAQVLAQR
jgi:hypothetical protein